MNLSDTALELLASRSLVRVEETPTQSAFSRFEKKYLLSKENLVALLQELPATYHVLTAENNVIQAYQNHYFDTENYQFYNDHHKGKLPRIKVRKRTYLGSENSFWELKFKEKNGRMLKSRIDCKLQEHLPIIELLKEIGREMNLPKLCGTLENFYNRIALEGREEDPRITLDFNLTFKFEEQTITVNDLVILECKKSSASVSALEKTLKKLQIKPLSFSKYCIGMALLSTDVKKNNFLPILRELKLGSVTDK